MRNYTAHNANVPQPRQRHDYSPDDIIELADDHPARPRLFSEATPGVNVPFEGETWAELEAFRARYGLPPVRGV